MPLDDRQAWILLHQLDEHEPDHLEVPRGYNHAVARARFNRLAAGLEHAFDCACRVDRGVQDASHHGTILIPEEAVSSPDHITVTVSNFARPGRGDARQPRLVRRRRGA